MVAAGIAEAATAGVSVWRVHFMPGCVKSCTPTLSFSPCKKSMKRYPFPILHRDKPVVGGVLGWLLGSHQLARALICTSLCSSFTGPGVSVDTGVSVALGKCCGESERVNENLKDGEEGKK